MAKHFQRTGGTLLGVNLQGWIRGFFQGNAALSIVVLFLICAFLVSEAVRFFPQHHRDLQVYRKSGQEYVGFIIDEVEDYTQLVSLTNQAYYQELDHRFGKERGLVEAFEIMIEPLEDEGEDQIEALEEAQDEGDEEAFQKALADWKDFVRREVGQMDRKQVDSFGRLDDAAWAALLNGLQEWDPIEGEPISLVVEAQQRLDEGMATFTKARDGISAAGTDLKQLRNQLVKVASAIKAEAVADKTAAERKAALLEGAETMEDPSARAAQIEKAEAIVIRDSFPYQEKVAEITASQQAHEAAVKALKGSLAATLPMLPRHSEDPVVDDLLEQAHAYYPELLESLDESLAKADAWSWDEPLSALSSAMRFFFGSDWVTNSSWHDFYGLLPLFTGSLLISLVALAVAVPFSIAAAIYVNRLSSYREQTLIKPVIELIQAIPSVVLGFFGIVVLGEGLRELSTVSALSWIPGFPMQERLNVLNAGLLLALMAVPTIFTLCEDALNNVPRSFTEASLALGASKLQTVIKVVLPAASSGVLAAILLGFGRIIGETMVVLLVAGNKISLPDWSAGIGVITQPTHTMTGIIAQEMGEVTEGTLHFRALFLVGLILFTISLIINVLAQNIIRRLSRA